MITIWVNLVAEVSFLHGVPLNIGVSWWDAMQNVPLCLWFESASVLRIYYIQLNSKIFALIVHTNWKCISDTWVLTYRMGRWCCLGLGWQLLVAGLVDCLSPGFALGWAVRAWDGRSTRFSGGIVTPRCIFDYVISNHIHSKVLKYGIIFNAVSAGRSCLRTQTMCIYLHLPGAPWLDHEPRPKLNGTIASLRRSCWQW